MTEKIYWEFMRGTESGMVKPIKAIQGLINQRVLTDAEVIATIAKCEGIVGMSGAELLARQKDGSAPDTFEANLLGMLVRTAMDD